MTDTVKLNRSNWLNKLFTFICALGVTLTMVAPFSVVKADDINSSASFIEVTTKYELIQVMNKNSQTNYVSAGILSGGNSPVYFYNFQLSNSNVFQIFISESYFSVKYYAGTDSSLGVPGEYSSVQDSNSKLYYTWYSGAAFANTSSVFNPDTGYFRNPNNNSYFSSVNEFLSYIAGIGVGGGGSSFTLGSIEDVKYSTQINSHGDDSVDTITWYPYFDSNNNPAVGWNAQIRVVPGYYYDTDRNSLMQQAFNLFHKEEDQAELIYNDHFVQGSFSITWGDVRNKISITSWQDLFGSFVDILDGSYWYKRGWIYQIRIYDRDNDLYSEWQDVYTVTSSSGEGVEKIIDPTSGGGSSDFYNNVENSFNTTSVVNNNYDVIYYYINTPVDTNPSSDDSNEYLKEIRNNVIQIRQLISIDNNANNTPNNDTNPWIGDPAAELYDFEDNSINDFNDAVGDLPSSDLVTGTKFLAASTWVRTQYEAIVSNTPIEAVIIFSLLLGFGLLLIGKLR